MSYFIRQLQPEDSLHLIELLNTLDNESNFSVYAPGERRLNPFQLATAVASHNQIVFGAETSGKLVGCIILLHEKTSKIAHCAALSLGVLQNQQRQGIGQALLHKAEEWAKLNDVRRLELSVAANNDNAVRLYQKMGYSGEGTKKGSLLIDATYTDEHIMAKILA